MIIDFRIFGYYCYPLHDTDGLIIIVMTKFHFSPFTPYFCKVLNSFEVDLCCLLQYSACAIKVFLRFTSSTTFFIEFGEVDIQPVEVRSGATGVYRDESLVVCLGNLEQKRGDCGGHGRLKTRS